MDDPVESRRAEIAGRVKFARDDRRSLLKPAPPPGQERVIRQEQEVMAHGCARVKALYDLIDEKASGIREYDDNLAARIIRQVTVQSKEQISVKFNEIGIELEMSLNG